MTTTLDSTQAAIAQMRDLLGEPRLPEDTRRMLAAMTHLGEAVASGDRATLERAG